MNQIIRITVEPEYIYTGKKKKHGVKVKIYFDANFVKKMVKIGLKTLFDNDNALTLRLIDEDFGRRYKDTVVANTLVEMTRDQAVADVLLTLFSVIRLNVRDDDLQRLMPHILASEVFYNGEAYDSDVT